jgi:putative transposase
MMRYTQAEKMEIIRLVENSDLSIRATLKELDVPKTSFYRWYHRYQEEGYEGLADRGHTARRFWNKIPQQVRDEIVEIALAEPEKSPREIAWQFTDCTSSKSLGHPKAKNKRDFPNSTLTHFPLAADSIGGALSSFFV